MDQISKALEKVISKLIDTAIAYAEENEMRQYTFIDPLERKSINDLFFRELSVILRQTDYVVFMN